MEPFALYGCKEWRDQRASVFFMCAALPLRFGFSNFTWESHKRYEGLGSGLSAAIGALTALF